MKSDMMIAIGGLKYRQPGLKDSKIVVEDLNGQIGNRYLRRILVRLIVQEERGVGVLQGQGLIWR